MRAVSISEVKTCSHRANLGSVIIVWFFPNKYPPAVGTVLTQASQNGSIAGHEALHFLVVCFYGLADVCELREDFFYSSACLRSKEGERLLTRIDTIKMFGLTRFFFPLFFLSEGLYSFFLLSY